MRHAEVYFRALDGTIGVVWHLCLDVQHARMMTERQFGVLRGFHVRTWRTP